MAICKACDKVYADRFEVCPHCSGRSNKVLGYITLAVVGLAASVGFWALVDSGAPVSSPRPPGVAIENLGPPTGSVDPYSAGQRALVNTEYEEAKQKLIHRSQMTASAARCRVIEDVESQVIIRNGINAISRADLNAGRSDYHPDLLPAVRAAALSAYERAGQPGGCAFWEQNPQAVADIRRLAHWATAGP